MTSLQLNESEFIQNFETQTDLKFWGKIYLTLVNPHAKCEPKSKEGASGISKLYSTVSFLFAFVADKRDFAWLKADTNPWLESPLWTNSWTYRAPKGII